MDEIKETSPAGIKFLMANEGFKLNPYLDTKGIPTIGVGNTFYEDGSKVKMSDPPLTESRALGLFRFVLRHYELAVYSNTRDDLNQNQFDALVSFTYNIGVNGFKDSTLIRRINAGATEKSIESAFMMWRKPPEIITRRQREVKLYFTPV
jgi:lysozyme